MPNMTTDAHLARLDERLNSIERMLNAIADDQRAAAEGRRRIYEGQERIDREIIGFTHRVTAVEKAIETIRPTTAELERVRDRVVFAGSLGSALWSVGKALIAAAAGAAGMYYAITGRPPP